MVKKILLRLLIVSAISLLLLVGSVYALTYSNYITVTVYNNSSTSYSSIPVLIGINNTELYNFGFIQGLDESIQEGNEDKDFTVGSPNIAVFLDEGILNQQTKQLVYGLQATPYTNPFSIIFPPETTATIDDSASLDLTTNIDINVNDVVITPVSDGQYFTGGTVTTAQLDGIWYRVHTFTAGGTLTVVTAGEVHYLVVGGGGGGGGVTATAGCTIAAGGGGGAGQLVTGTIEVSSNQVVTIGTGGTSGNAVSGTNGNFSSLGSLVTAIGGGGGGRGSTSSLNGLSGASGGGGGACFGPNIVGSGGSGTAGFDGGDGSNAGSGAHSGGGGGSGAVGGDGSAIGSGSGGAGVEVDIPGDISTLAVGGTGASPIAGGANTGNGGGGAFQDGGASAAGGAGGSGIVVVWYPINYSNLLCKEDAYCMYISGRAFTGSIPAGTGGAKEASFDTTDFDTSHDYRMTYDGTDLVIYIDGVSVATDSVVGDIGTSANNIIMTLIGKTGTVSVSSLGGSDVLDLSQASTIPSDTIEDQSGNSNDAVISWGSNFDGIEITTSGITPSNPHVAPSVEESSVDIFTSPFNFLFGEGCNNPTTLPLYTLVKKASDSMEMQSACDLYLSFILLSTIATLAGFTIATGSGFLGLSISLGLLAVGTKTGILDPWVPFTYGVVGYGVMFLLRRL